MGLRCLMGHDFGEVLTDHDRRERGDEVVVTITEYRECDRCGETRVVSENKEVRHANPTTPDSAADERDAEADAGGAADAPAVSVGTSGFEDDDISAEEDDGVILEDEPEVRDPGAWPEAEGDDAEEDEESAEPTPWPEVEGEDEGYAAEPSEGGALEGVEFGSGLTPEATTGEASGSAIGGDDAVESSRGTGGSGFRRTTSIPSSSGRQRSDESNTEFFCPECEHTTPTDGSSLRPGDICPNCRLGYLTERKQ